MQMNLLAEPFRIRMALRGQLRRWSLVWIVCVAAVVIVCSSDIYRVKVLRDQLKEVQLKAQSTQRIVDQSDHVRRRLAAAKVRNQTLRRLQPEDHSLPSLGILTAGVHHSDHRVQVQRFVMQSDRTPPKIRQANTANNKAESIREVATVVSIHGIATSDQAVSKFLDHLRSYQLFRQVDLKSTSVLSGSAQAGREFHVECHY